MIRVLHIIPLVAIGGVESLLLSQCEHRDRERFEYAVACPQEHVSGMADEIRGTGVPFLQGKEALAGAVQDADIVNVHAWSADATYLEYFARCGKPYVVTLHWLVTLPPVRGVILCTSENARGWQSGANRCVTIGNGVDTRRFAAPPRPARDEVVITRVCRTEKCAPYFWEVAARVLRRYPQVRLRIAGNSQPCEHPDARVQFLGLRRDIPDVLAESDLFLYTPRPETGTRDLVTMEAMASGLPCIVSDVSAVRDVVEDGVTGFRLPYGDVEGAAAAVGRLVEDHALRLLMGRAAAERARTHFDIEAVTRRYEAAYAAVLETHGSAGQLARL